ncbi:hypothetical protein LAZ67_10001891 [Cordylochernes scorpioides]|uniref:PiggyBac transposable element-derived protein domain-containing protein n=1 Tax=Cordylochernes scorpioides TaxID=51811 RepID=A0ABY6L150_9ARAC|nr:hypothetical protein LAZ67_10001891 [Cordylochernes scorpioides]
MHSTATIDEETNEEKKPEMITFYNMTKGGVDLLDQKTSLYSVGRRTKRWPLSIFFELLNISGVNSKLLFDGNQPQNFYKRRKDFLKTLSFDFVTEYHHISSIYILPYHFQNHFEVLSGNMLDSHQKLWGSVEGWSKPLVFDRYDPGSNPKLGTIS